jgi:hypothetical protein
MQKEKCRSFPYRSGTNPECDCTYCFDNRCKNMVTTKKCHHMCADLKSDESMCCRCKESAMCSLCNFFETKMKYALCNTESDYKFIDTK